MKKFMNGLKSMLVYYSHGTNILAIIFSFFFERIINKKNYYKKDSLGSKDPFGDVDHAVTK